MFSALVIFVSLIIINIEMTNIVLCEHQKNNFFFQEVAVREGRFTLRKIYHVPRVAVMILLLLLATLTILLLRTQDRRARNETFDISGGTKFIITLFHFRSQVLNIIRMHSGGVTMAKYAQNY